MYLYRERSKFADRVCLMESFELAVKKAREWVGDHDPSDGCSSPLTEGRTNTSEDCTFALSRSTSWGPRFASVLMIKHNETVDLF